MTITFTLPLHTVSANVRDSHWSKRHKRVKGERNEIGKACMAYGVKPLKDGETATVTLRRIAPRKLDLGDNLAYALKPTRDEVARALGIDDGDPRVTWEYSQNRDVRTPRWYGVGVSIEITSPSQDFEAMVDELTFPGTGGAK
jgi:hypothetical protein